MCNYSFVKTLLFKCHVSGPGKQMWIASPAHWSNQIQSRSLVQRGASSSIGSFKHFVYQTKNSYMTSKESDVLQIYMDATILISSPATNRIYIAVNSNWWHQFIGAPRQKTGLLYRRNNPRLDTSHTTSFRSLKSIH